MSPLQESMSDALSLTIPPEQWPVGLSCPVDGELLESLHHWAPSTRHIEEARGGVSKANFVLFIILSSEF